MLNSPQTPGSKPSVARSALQRATTRPAPITTMPINRPAGPVRPVPVTTMPISRPGPGAGRSPAPITTMPVFRPTPAPGTSPVSQSQDRRAVGIPTMPGTPVQVYRPAPLQETGNLATITQGLSPQDKYEVEEEHVRIGNDYQRAVGLYNNGLTDIENVRRHALASAIAGQVGSTYAGLSAASETGGGWGGATSGNAVAQAVNQGTLAMNSAQSDWSASQTRLLNEITAAEMADREARARLSRNAARRRDYAAEIRSRGGSF